MRLTINNPFPAILNYELFVHLHLHDSAREFDIVTGWLNNVRPRPAMFESYNRNSHQTPLDFLVAFADLSRAQDFLVEAASRSQTLLVSEIFSPHTFSLSTPSLLSHVYQGGHESFAAIEILFGASEMENTFEFEFDSSVLEERTTHSNPFQDVWLAGIASEYAANLYNFLIPAFSRYGKPTSLRVAFQKIAIIETYRWDFGVKIGLRDCVERLYRAQTEGRAASHNST